ncbi:hypothetical protein FBF83_20510 [Pseudalkalibacillus hwajinpoensis]|uniref:Phage capsid protein n=2 Tax=Guptibacillus hwajinpoensis TaxID=208199 RepID=A0A4U1M610_9BACL|nr:DUF6366 family protein [Pseudalkalibacillus hwajinpoensis]TKD65703.1 hypothetical protein FBF83_20510 [Pseudalkalibacillus hwajinpoensis]
MMDPKKSPERNREELRQEELKRNTTGNISDSFNRANNGGLVDLVGSLGWKGTLILIGAIIIGFIIASLIF